VVLGGWVTSFVLTLIGFNWVAHLLHEFAHFPWVLAFLGMLVFAGVAHLFIPLAGALWYLGRRYFSWSDRLALGFMGLLTIICEAYSVTLFDWNFGYSWYGYRVPVFHLAEIIGFTGLSALTLLFNIPFYLAWQYRHRACGKTIFGSALTVFLVLSLSGGYLRDRLPQPDASLNALLVQANIGNEEKHAAELGTGFRDEILSIFQRVTDRGLLTNRGDRIDFAVWPEAAFPSILGPGYSHLKLARNLKNYLSDRQLPLVTGGYGVDKPTGLVTNSLFALNDRGAVMQPHYSKTLLLAFGEYIPGESYFPVIREWLPPIGHYARGPGPTVLLKINSLKIGPQICYESLFPSFSRGLADLGAEVIVNVTNDSWYGTWQEPYQHMYMTLARAVEFRRPVIRATNTGISTVALASGDILERSPLHAEWSGLYQVRYMKNPHVTFYQDWYWLVPSILWGALVLMLGFSVRSRFRNTS